MDQTFEERRAEVLLSLGIERPDDHLEIYDLPTPVQDYLFELEDALLSLLWDYRKPV